MIGLTPAECDTLRRLFVRFPEIEEVVLVGARALGTHRPGSDVDLALKGKVTRHTLSRLKQILEEETNLPYFFDIVEYKAGDLQRAIDEEGVGIYASWCAALQEHLSSGAPNYEEAFRIHAECLMKNYMLLCDGEQFELCELEYYFFDPTTHLDPYCHNHCLQLRCGGFYIHRLGGTRGGVDLTFGNGSYFGGILIRGLKHNREYIVGPNNCKRAIDSEADCTKLQEQADKKWAVVAKPEKTNHSLFRSTRIGLNDAPCDQARRYKEALYRFARKDYFSQGKGIKEKTKLKPAPPLEHSLSDKC